MTVREGRIIRSMDYLTHEEQLRVTEASSEDRARLVALLWSGKESTLKAMGVGLRVDTRCISVKPGEVRTATGVAHRFAPRGWSADGNPRGCPRGAAGRVPCLGDGSSSCAAGGTELRSRPAGVWLVHSRRPIRYASCASTLAVPQSRLRSSAVIGICSASRTDATMASSIASTSPRRSW